jgi:hypothetical protein
MSIAAAVIWLLLWCDWSAWHWLPLAVHAVLFSGYAIVAGYLLWKNRRAPMLQRCLIGTVAMVVFWHWSVLLSSSLSLHWLARVLAQCGLVMAFVTGLLWLIWIVDQQSRKLRERNAALAGNQNSTEREWNPLDLTACYYRRRSRKLDQSMLTLISYTLVFGLLFLILTQLSGCREIYEMPAGGGEQQRKQIVKIQKIIEKKLVINPFSSVIFNPPPIEDIQLQLQEVTKHAYEVGYGEGKGAGFSGGTTRGKTRFIRLEYAGGDWDQDFGVGSDLNMLLEYGIRTGHKIHDRTESRRIAQLENFPLKKSPPMVYMTGQKNIIVSNSEIETLRDYLLEKHGMIFGDNGGSQGWHGQFFEMMRRALPRVKPIRVPLDHTVHRIPNEIPFLPYVAPHGGKDAWGWVVDGRLVCYYHPGDIGDAWADGHAGVKREIWEYCYQLGTNLIFYSQVEYNKWLDSQNNSEKASAKE